MQQSHTEQMIALMGQIRKQMNGAMLDTFRYYGRDYGVNYGVTVHTLRDMARSMGEDDAFARFLYRQQVRELRLIAVWIASPQMVQSVEDLQFWADGVVNSEVAEQIAQALLSRTTMVDTLLHEWCSGDDELLAYAALMAASRTQNRSVERCCQAIQNVSTRFSDSRLALLGVVALAASMLHNEKERTPVLECVAALADNPTVRSIKEEVAWRAEY